MSAIEDEKSRIEAVERDFPGFQVWTGPVSHRWSGRLIGAHGPAEILTGEDEAQLREKIDEWLSR